MALQLNETLVIGISSRALFNLEEENAIYEKEGLAAYSAYQLQHEKDILKPGAGFPLVKALLRLNTLAPLRHRTEVIILSRNSADTSLRIFNSVEHYGLDISRAALVGGAAISGYLNAFDTDLFLSANEGDVQDAVNAGVAAGLIYTAPEFAIDPAAKLEQIRIAFDGDAVLFTDESEQIFKAQGLDAFADHDRKNAQVPLPEGPFAKLLKTLATLQKEFGHESVPIRTALVTARNAPAHERAIRTLRAWDVRVDEAFFLGGVNKSEVLRAFAPHIFFDDQSVHTTPASQIVPTARVPYKKEG